MKRHLLKLDASKAFSANKLKDFAKPYQAPLMCVAYALQTHLKRARKDYKNNKYYHQ